jgi:hypothetical protein
METGSGKELAGLGKPPHHGFRYLSTEERFRAALMGVAREIRHELSLRHDRNATKGIGL